MGLRVFSYRDIQERGIESITAEILKIIKSQPLHVSFDIDSMDPRISPSTGVPVGGSRLEVQRTYLAAFKFLEAALGDPENLRESARSPAVAT